MKFIEQNRGVLSDYVVEIILLILITIFYIPFLIFNVQELLMVTYMYIIILCLVGFKKFPIISISTLSVIVMLISFTLYFATSDSNNIIAGLTFVLIIVTFWYAFNADRQFKITENDRKGKYIAELSRSIFSPMQKSLHEAKKNLQLGSYIKYENPIKICLSKTDPSFYLTQDIEIIPEKRSNNSINKVTRPASFLLKIKKSDEILRYRLTKIESLNQDYNGQLNDLQSIYLTLQSQITSVLPDFKRFITKADPEGFKELLDVSKKETDNENNVLSKIIISTVIHQKCVLYLNQSGEEGRIYDKEGTQPPVTVSAKIKYLNLLLRFTNENQEKIMEWVESTPLSSNAKQLTKLQLDLLSTIDQLLDAIDSLLINWKLNYFLVEDEMHGA